MAQVPTAHLSDQANAALVAADNALKTSEQELGFAQAQYGAESVGPFAQALEASRADVAQAFRLRQQLDDDDREDEPTQRSMLREILDRCAAADQRLDAQAEAFDRLRAGVQRGHPSARAGRTARPDGTAGHRRARVVGRGRRAVLTASTIDAQFESLDDIAQDAEVEERLAKLKVGGPV